VCRWARVASIVTATAHELTVPPYFRAVPYLGRRATAFWGFALRQAFPDKVSPAFSD
jgi:hypothetical protein